MKVAIIHGNSCVFFHFLPSNFLYLSIYLCSYIWLKFYEQLERMCSKCNALDGSSSAWICKRVYFMRSIFMRNVISCHNKWMYRRTNEFPLKIHARISEEYFPNLYANKYENEIFFEEFPQQLPLILSIFFTRIISFRWNVMISSGSILSNGLIWMVSVCLHKVIIKFVSHFSKLHLDTRNNCWIKVDKLLGEIKSDRFYVCLLVTTEQQIHTYSIAIWCKLYS